MPKRILPRSHTILLPLVLLIPFLLPHARAAAQAPVDQQKCIVALNESLAKVAKAQGKDIGRCIKNRAKGKLDGSTIDECTTADHSGQVARARETTIKKAAKKCPGPPDFGPADPNTVNQVAVDNELGLIHDIFGSDLDATVLHDSEDLLPFKCQAKVAKSVQKCQQTRLEEFNRCKKTGLTAGFIQSQAELAICLGRDPKGKISKFCEPGTGRIQTTIDKRCVGKGGDLSDAFPPCDTDDAQELGECLNERTECRICLALNGADGLSEDCDALDDGDPDNLSCPPCGNGILEPGEQCDDGNNDDGDGCNSSCQLEFCGDGIVNDAPNEECDDGNMIGGDGCSADCQLEFCGDGILQGRLGEECDDGNNDNGDGCDENCLLECGNGNLDPGEECDDGNIRDGDGCSADCRLEFCGDEVVNDFPNEQCDGDDDALCPGACEPDCTCSSGGGVIGIHKCVLDSESSFISLINQGLPLPPFAVSGSLDIGCGAFDPNNGKASCGCVLQSFDPIEIIGIGFVCFTRGASCPSGEIDCDGGNPLDIDMRSDHNIGTCTGHVDCEAQCAVSCASGEPFNSGCEGFCTEPPHAPCTQDVHCLPSQGSCAGKDLLPHSNICGCDCKSVGGNPSGAGGLQCNVGTEINVELDPPCGDGDILIAVGSRCIPLTTETLTAQVQNMNNTPGKDFPIPPSSATGIAIGCPTMATSTLTGLKLVGAVNFFDSTIGDLQTNEVFSCQ